ncbi:MAG: DMT family transporter [Proteobacteria bacterium]|nr:DMT family transporter [Pseudomonadota bacterium]
MVSAPAPAHARPLGAIGQLVASPYLLLVYAMVFWSGNGIVGRAFAPAISPLTLSFWRWTIALLLLLPFTARAVWRVRTLIGRHWRLLLLYTVFGLVGCNVLTYAALHDTTAVNSSLMNSTTPIFVMCLSFVLFRDPIHLRQTLGVAVSLAGVVAIVSAGRLDSLGGLAINRGDLMMLAGIGLWSIYTALLRRKPEGMPPMAFVTVLIAFASLLELPFYLVEAALVGGVRPSLPNLLAIVYVAAFPAVLALLCWNRAVAALGANRCAPFVHLMPVIGTVMAVIFLGEQFGAHHAIGIALVLVGVYLASRRRAV